MKNKKSWILIAICVLLAVVAGAVMEHKLRLGHRLGGGSQEAASFDAKHAALHEDPNYVCPMHPWIASEDPGQCPICGMDLVVSQAAAGTTQETEGLPVVTIAPEVVNNLGVRIAMVERRTLQRRIDTVGYVEYDLTQLSYIYPAGAGNIRDLSVSFKGERVRRGQLLFRLFSPRAGNYFDDAYSEMDGVVVALNVSEGAYVTPVTQAVTLGDLSNLWLIADVFESQAAWVAVGQRAEVRLPYILDRSWKGKVEYIYPDLDPETRTLKVRMRFANPGETLKPNMHAEVTIYTGQREALAIPRDALIETGEQQRVILALGEGRFQPRDVTRGMESGGWVEIKDGLKEGERVVVSGQFLIDSESSLTASLMRMTEKPDKHTPKEGAEEDFFKDLEEK